MPLNIDKKENNKINRINNIFELLKSGSFSTKELADMFGVTPKTVTRDMEILQTNGVKKNKNHWELDKSMIQDGLNGDERVLLNILDNIAKGIGSNFYAKTHPLLKQLSMQLNQPFFAFLGSEEPDEAMLKKFEIIQQAIANKNIIKCDYKKHKFEIKPLKIALFEGFWYLLLLDCHAGDKFKRFYFKDIKNIEVINEKFKIPDKFEKRLESANSVWFELENSHTARLLIMPIVAKYFERKKYIKGDIMCRNNDGSIEIECEFSNIMEIKPLIYYFLPHIKVIEPAWLNDEIKAEIAGYLGEIS